MEASKMPIATFTVEERRVIIDVINDQITLDIVVLVALILGSWYAASIAKFVPASIFVAIAFTIVCGILIFKRVKKYLRA